MANVKRKTSSIFVGKFSLSCRQASEPMTRSDAARRKRPEWVYLDSNPTSLLRQGAGGYVYVLSLSSSGELIIQRPCDGKILVEIRWG